MNHTGVCSAGLPVATLRNAVEELVADIACNATC
jgi:hypothetical protein